METELILPGVLIAGYVGIITWLSLGLLPATPRKKTTSAQAQNPSLSILIACRNEADTIGALLCRLIGHLDPADEIVLVDDHSEDETLERVNEFSNLNIKILRLQDQPIPRYGKKQAIALGLAHASGDLILFTDADCLPGPRWIPSMRDCMQSAGSNAVMVLAPVVPESSGSILHTLELLEFGLLMTVTECSAVLGNPVLSNASNVLISREAYTASGAFSGNLHIASGDDMFLLEKIKKHYGNKAIVFNPDPAAILRTRPVSGVKQWIQQRLRWASKAKGYRDPTILLTSLIIYAYPVALLITFMLFLRHGGQSALFPTLFLIKVLVDLPLVAHGIRRYGKARLWWWYLPAQFGGMGYISFVGLFGQILPSRWKGRKSRV